jgi:hypothetical protein
VPCSRRSGRRLASFGRGALEHARLRTGDRGGARLAPEWLRLAGVRTRYSTVIPACDRTRVDGIPSTTAARTLIDLAAVSPRWRVEEALDEAERRGLISLAQMRRRVDALGGRGRRGIATIRRLLDDRDPAQAVPESVWERRLLRAIRAAGLPDPVLQFEIRHGGQLVARVDAAYPDHRVAVDYDTYRYHAGRAKYDRDLARRNRLSGIHWTLLHATARTVPECVVDVASLIAGQRTA